MKFLTLPLTAVIALLLLIFSSGVIAQNAGRFYSEGVAAAEAGHWSEAIDYFNKAIEFKPDYTDALVSRGKVFVITKKYRDAVKDFNAALLIKPGDHEVHVFAGNAELSLGMCNEALSRANKSIEIKKKFMEAYFLACKAQMCRKDFRAALEVIEKSIQIDDENTAALLLKSRVADTLGMNDLAISSATRAIELLMKSKEWKNSTDKQPFKEYFVAQAQLFLKQAAYNDLLAATERGISLYPEDGLFYAMKGVSLSSKGNNSNALETLNKAITLSDKNASYLTYRGNHFYKTGQTDQAMGDFQRALMFEPANADALYGKARCLDANNNPEEALKTLRKITLENPSIVSLKAAVTKKVYEKNRESIQPEFTLASASKAGYALYIPKDSVAFTIKGTVSDKSTIRRIVINGTPANYDSTELNPSFTCKVVPSGGEGIEILVSDIYGNTITKKYSVIRSENNPPVITLLSPQANGKEIVLSDTSGYTLRLKAQVDDASDISRIEVNGNSVTFNVTAKPVVFSFSLDIVGLDSLRVKATDIFNNSTVLAFKLNRTLMSDTVSNPMGKTWAVFIDNSNYQNLPSLQASANDVNAMKNALSAYSIDKIIVRKDMTKQDMERFFASELRDQVNTGNVNSILIWFAGHGKFLNETGYWLPVDANKKDDFTFFSLNNLRGYLSGYPKVKHTLVVSDACETGPAFYLAMRDGNLPRECGNWETTRLRSAQVFSSTNIDLNDDKSEFTRSFVNILKGLNDKCISIDKVSERVGQLSKQSQKPKPKLGNIQGLKDENGTFYFIRK